MRFAPAETASDEAIIIQSLSKNYGNRTVLDSIDLSVGKGVSYALLGPNGAGKTTLISILCTLLRPDSGTARVAGADVVRQPVEARRGIGVVFQDSSLDDRLTAFENLDFHGLVYGIARRKRAQQIDEMLALVELSEWRNAVVRSFSGGMKRRLEIARALLHQPSILFLDEPTVGLDAQTRQRIWEYIDELRMERGLTVIVTTHYIEEVERCGAVCIIDNGRILAEGRPDTLKARYGRSVLRILPRDESASDAIRHRHPSSVALDEGRIAIALDGEEFADSFLAEFGTQVREFAIDGPNLESVFLSLTGRELRDGARKAAARGTGRRAGKR